MNTTKLRVAKLRTERKKLGMRRLDLYVHEDDIPQVRDFIAAIYTERLRADAAAERASKLVDEQP